MELIQLENKNDFMFYLGESPQELWNFLQLGLGKSMGTDIQLHLVGYAWRCESRRVAF